MTQAAHRARLLRALGVTPWRRRAAPAVPERESSVAAMPAAEPDCVVLLPAGCAPRELDLLGRAFLAFGPRLARAARIEVGAAPLQAPRARAYLALGEAQAHALGRDLPAEWLHQAHVVLADTPAVVLAGGDGKRRLWSALRALRRALAAHGG
ncbi:hypothetical protein QMK61_05415 [Fulvimonas sp. R45]|uniref:hypothetical protein n=1 Tax=Fulvimonas sp. R45 TaxID=3045937 RepID=UPI00265FEDB3|nr:hypothetical protein [Fulvimonas sp. R45]MDO1528269.1 hypothetical protein [Fulvimonas sp. R45]